MIVADDLGYSDIGSYGGEINTPNLDKLAKNGLRFSHFTSNAVCSSTRASLLTGLNHHSVGTGWLAEWDFGYPGYRGEISSNTMTLAEILKQQGYATYMVGKWHLTNAKNRSRIGPFNSWPQGRGFERYWGFLDGETSQWKPHALISGNETLPPQSYTGNDDFYLPDTLTDKAIAIINDLRSHNSDKPFFLYYATGTPHAPHHTKAEDRKKYLGKYQQGWDKIRLQRIKQQKNLGLIPENTLLSDYIPGVEAWDNFTTDQQKMYARLEENYAGFVDNMDQNIGRLLAHLEKIGETENTLIIFLSDNGGSREVGLEGSSNALRFFHKKPSTTAQNLKDFDRIGEIETHPHYPLGWMQVSNTPFIYSKRTSYDGGTRVPLIISWPKEIKKPGIRHQFHHVTDITPTIMEALNLTLPKTYKGNPIKPMEGVSLKYTFNDADATDQKKEQYYEIEGSRAYYKDGWKAISHREPNQKIADTHWQLFNLKDDFAATIDVADKYPEKLTLKIITSLRLRFPDFQRKK
ncbi:arylsulfatase [Bathymodiolus platifrons methanotrophic gill symbiont]|uniref:arylsulfatase n=2 Tax=Bathymodiolus platifrons methanotrophic gill symbiont TaxID=113268 RepID=UPI001C8E960C|nr:arylsulfatase [Bathymodiolus platifrons methanotrophic gill symbiont]